MALLGLVLPAPSPRLPFLPQAALLLPAINMGITHQILCEQRTSWQIKCFKTVDLEVKVFFL